MFECWCPERHRVLAGAARYKTGTPTHILAATIRLFTCQRTRSRKATVNRRVPLAKRLQPLGADALVVPDSIGRDPLELVADCRPRVVSSFGSSRGSRIISRLTSLSTGLV